MIFLGKYPDGPWPTLPYFWKTKILKKIEDTLTFAQNIFIQFVRGGDHPHIQLWQTWILVMKSTVKRQWRCARQTTRAEYIILLGGPWIWEHHWLRWKFPMENKFWEIRILGGCTAVDNFAQSAQQRRHGNQNMKSSLFQPNFFANTSEKCSHYMT